MPTSTVRVSNLSLDSTEDSVKDYFSFCGDIQNVTITEGSEDARSKEAEIVFENESASSTAVLLNNALVDGKNIQVVLVGQEDNESGYGAANATANAYGNTSNASLNSTAKSSVVSEIMSEAKSVASQVSSATRDLNTKYDVTGKLKNAYTTAATTTATTFASLDSQYNIRDNTNKALEATKTGLSSMYRQVSGFWSKQAGGSAGNLNSADSTNSASSNGSTPHSDTQ